MADNPDIWTVLKRVDELRDEMSVYREQTNDKLTELRTMIMEKEAALEKDIFKLEKNYLLEGSDTKTKIVLLGFRVIVITLGLLGLLGWVAKDVHFSDFFDGRASSAATKRK